MLPSWLDSRVARPDMIDDALHRDPHNADHNIHPLPLPSLILKTPHPILLIIPVRPTRTMHPPPPHLLLRVRAHTHAILPAFPRVRQVLDDGAVDGEFVARGGGVRAGGFGDEGFEDRVDDGVVPGFGRGVGVGGCGREGGVAGVGADLF